MSGRRNQGGAVKVVTDLYTQDRKARQDFEQRLAVAGINAGIKAGQIAPSFGKQGQFQGFQPAQPVQQPGLLGGVQGEQDPYADIIAAGGEVTQTIKTPQGTIRITRGGKQNAPKAPPMLPQSTANQMFGGAQPGQPLPSTRMGGRFGDQAMSNIPMGPRGVNTMNAAIQWGTTESPAAQFLGNRMAPHTVPQGPFAQGPGNSFVGGNLDESIPGQTIPRSQVMSLLQQPRGAMPGLSMLTRSPAPMSNGQAIGTTVTRGGKRWVIVGYDDQGEPLVEPAP